CMHTFDVSAKARLRTKVLRRINPTVRRKTKVTATASPRSQRVGPLRASLKRTKPAVRRPGGVSPPENDKAIRTDNGNDKEKEKEKDKEQWYSAHAQATVVTQKPDSFRSPYMALNSLPPFEPYVTSETTTVFLAARLWEGGELIFNPEVSGGKGFG